jgi:DNA-binding transcriptional LysR family regulator
VAVCAPGILADQPFASAGELADLVLLQCTSRPEAWHEWFDEQGINTDRSYHGPRFDTFYMCIGAARSGCGVALVPRFLVEDELAEGKLVIPWQHHKASQGSHFMAHAEQSLDIPKVRSFVDWILEKAQGKNQCRVNPEMSDHV